MQNVHYDIMSFPYLPCSLIIIYFCFSYAKAHQCSDLCVTNGSSLISTIMDKSLGTLLRFSGVFQFTQVKPLPSPHKQRWTHVSKISSEFQLCIGWGGGRTATKFWKGCTVLRRNREMTEKYEYCSTVPRTFVQDCSFYPYFSCFVSHSHYPYNITLHRWKDLCLVLTLHFLMSLDHPRP